MKIPDSAMSKSLTGINCDIKTNKISAGFTNWEKLIANYSQIQQKIPPAIKTDGDLVFLNQKTPEIIGNSEGFKLVAGAGFEPTTFRL